MSESVKDEKFEAALQKWNDTVKKFMEETGYMPIAGIPRQFNSGMVLEYGSVFLEPIPEDLSKENKQNGLMDKV